MLIQHKKFNNLINIISNDCSALFIYRQILNIPYQNPFVGTFIDNDQFLYLIKNFKDINFNKIDFTFTENKFFLNDLPYFIANIDSKLQVNYVHYNDISNKTKLSVNYFKRLSRMSNNIDLIVISDDSKFRMDIKEIVDYAKVNISSAKIIILSYDDYSSYNNDNILFLQRKGMVGVTIDSLKEKILNFIYDNQE